VLFIAVMLWLLIMSLFERRLTELWEALMFKRRWGSRAPAGGSSLVDGIVGIGQQEVQLADLTGAPLLTLRSWSVWLCMMSAIAAADDSAQQCLFRRLHRATTCTTEHEAPSRL